MESPRENKNGCETSETKILPVDSGDQKGFQNQEGSSPVIKWSEEFRCYTVNGILAPVPLSAIPMEPVAENEQQESASSGQGESNKKKRKTEGNEEFFFRLFKFPKSAEQYLLEMHEVKTGGIYRCHVCVHENNGRWKVGVYDLEPADHVVLPLLQDPSPPIFHKTYELSLQERLIGWTVEKRKRGNGKEDKFYYHRSRQFRSFVEVTTFILYSCKVKDLRIMSSHKTSMEVLEAEAAEAMMKISSSSSHGNSNICTSNEQKRSSGPLPDIVNEKTPEVSNQKQAESSSSSTKSADDQSKRGRCVEAASNTATLPQVEKNEVISEEGKNELSEADDTETNQFIDYITDIFEDDAPQTMNEIFGKPNQLHDRS